MANTNEAQQIAEEDTRLAKAIWGESSDEYETFAARLEDARGERE